MSKFVGMLVLCVAAAQAARGEIVNGGFEDGLTGWGTSEPFLEYSVGQAALLTPLNNPLAYWFPTEGNSFAYLRSGWSISGGQMYSSLWYRLPVAMGQVISFDFFFDAGDTLLNNDHGFYDLVVYNDRGVHTEIYRRYSVADVGAYGQIGWQHVSLTVPMDGYAQLSFAVIDQGAEGPNFSAVGVDNVRITPEPSALSFLAFGLAAITRRSR